VGKQKPVDTEPTEARTGSRPTERAADPKIQLTSVEPRIFGVVPPTLALVLGLAGLIGGIAILASGEIATGIGLAVLGLVLGALAIDSARRWPTSALPRLSVRVADAVGSRLGLAWFSTAEWAQASREVIRLRRELRALRKEREAQQSALGAAAYADDPEQMESLRRQLAELDARIGGCELAIDEAVNEARERVHRRRAAVQPTQPFAVAEEDPPPSEDSTTRTTPTAVQPGTESGEKGDQPAGSA
jgi:hypothetical protein